MITWSQAVLSCFPMWRNCKITLDRKALSPPPYSQWVKENWRLQGQRQQHWPKYKEHLSSHQDFPCVCLYLASWMINLASRTMIFNQGPRARLPRHCGKLWSSCEHLWQCFLPGLLQNTLRWLWKHSEGTALCSSSQTGKVLLTNIIDLMLLGS